MRILVPFLLFLPIERGIIFLAETWISYQATASTNPRSFWQQVAVAGTGFRWFTTRFNMHHLWFLWFLVLFYAIVLLVRPVIVRLDSSNRLRHNIDRRLAGLMGQWWGASGMTLFIVLPMLMQSSIGVDQSLESLVPHVAPFVVYGIFFTIGWLLHRQSGLIDRFRQHWRINAVIAAVLITGLTIAIMPVAHAVTDPDPAVRIPMPRLIATVLTINALYAFASMTAVFAFIGGIMALFSRPSRTVRYLADASYWMYLIHLFVALLIQMAVAPYDWPWPVKVLLILTGTLSVCLLTYQYGVRTTWLGVLLNGRRYPPRQGSDTSTAIESATGSVIVS